MIIGVPTEVKNLEYRVGMAPSGVSEAVQQGHSVIMQTNAGAEIGFTDTDYISAGAIIAKTAKSVYEQADFIVKVKELQPCEYNFIRNTHIIFNYAHLMPNKTHAHTIINSGCTTIAYEMVMDHRGYMPLLAPMSAISGRMAVQIAMHYLQKNYGGSGILLSGVSGVQPAKVTIIGGGTVGENAGQIAMRIGAVVTIVNRSINRLKYLNNTYPNIKTIQYNHENLAKLVKDSDVVIGGVLVKGELTPKLVTEDMVKSMKNGAVIVDVCIDLGGCCETSHPTSHSNPIYIKHGVLHYCVPNIPGLVARSATESLTNATLPYILEIANKGWQQACKDNIALKNGLNCANGRIRNKNIADFINNT